MDGKNAAREEVVAEETKGANGPEPLRIFALVKNSQQKHGLRHENYQRYRGYCSRRIERIRKSLKFMHAYKCLPKRTAKFVSRSVVAELVGDVRYLQIIVFEVERNWAYAMQFKFESMDEPLLRKKFHMRQKLRRAVKNALFLNALVAQNPLVHDVTMIEVKSYISFIYASLALELKQWKKAVDNFDIARAGYLGLLGQVKETDLHEMYATKCREVENLLNLCRTQSGDADVLLSTVGSINLNASEEQKAVKKTDELEMKMPKESKQQLRLKTKLIRKPKPIKPFFFDLALNFVKK